VGLGGIGVDRESRLDAFFGFGSFLSVQRDLRTAQHRVYMLRVRFQNLLELTIRFI
jgi:hypothetical protein